MNERQKTPWMLSFWHSEGSKADERDFPMVEFWHADRDTAIAEGSRVLCELDARGDNRDWVVAAHPDPFHVGSGLHPGGQWILKITELPSSRGREV